MGIEQVRKVIIISHQSSSLKLLDELQKEAILHISFAEEAEFIKGKETSKRIERVIRYIQSKCKNIPVRTVSPSLESPDETVEHIVKDIENLMEKENRLKQKIQELEKDYNLLTSWEPLEIKVEELGNFKHFKPIVGTLKNPSLYEEFVKEIGEKSIIEKISETENSINIVIFSSQTHLPEIHKILIRYGFEEINFKFNGTVKEHLENLKIKIGSLKKELEELNKKAESFKNRIEVLYLFHDFTKNKEIKESLLNILSGTKHSTIVSGWIKERDVKRFESLIKKLNGVDFIYPEKVDETPPVALRNKKLFRPFELIVEMYSLPLPDEVEPTSLMAPFFAFFFGLCLTDAVYGIILSIIAFYLIIKKKGGKLIGLMLAGGIFTVIAGAMTGGWLADFFKAFHISPLFNLSRKVMLFDPMEEPMKFFILSIGLGFFQYVFGILIEVYDSLRHKYFIEGIFEHFAWVIFLISLVAIGLGLSDVLPKDTAVKVFLPLILISATSIIFFSIKNIIPDISLSIPWAVFIGTLLASIFYKNDYIKYTLKFSLILTLLIGFIKSIPEKKIAPIISLFIGIVVSVLWLLSMVPWYVALMVALASFMTTKSTNTLTTRFLLGLYNLYNGGVGTLSAVLSYVRLMALGMVTGGIGMAINAIVKMMFTNPFGIFFGIIILIFGHIYNLAINVLGGFVHTMRLQYVEFFPRFFTGGGEPFKPFKLENDFVKIKKEV